MQRTSRRALAAGSLAVALGLTVAGAGVANAATDPPDLAVVVGTTQVTAERYVWEGGTYMYLDLGVNLVAGKNPFEIWASRKTYAEPIAAYRVAGGQRTALPAGLVDSFEGLRDFSRIVVKDAAGATVKDYSTTFCPNDYSSTRTRRDAPAQTPYPQGCAGANPFTLGAVWGIQAGWNASLDSMPRDWYGRGKEEGEEFDIPAGSYAVTVEVNPKYRSVLGLTDAESTVALDLKVVDVVEDEAGLAVAKAKSAAAGKSFRNDAALLGAHGEHGGQGDAALQVTGFDPQFRPPAKAPKTLAASPKSGPKPDLRSLPAWGISLSTEGGKDYVNFGATVWNAGTSPLRVDGFRRTGTELMDAYQYFFDAAGNEVGSVEAGTMEWDPRDGHRHWHFTDFAQYNLLNADKTLSVRSGKEAFCLANTDAVDYTLPDAKWRPTNTDLSSSCGANSAVAVREVLDVGGGDTYDQSRPGQNFEVTDLPNGTYYIQVLANPSNKLAELKTGNNSALRKIVLGGKPGARTLKVPAVHGITG